MFKNFADVKFKSIETLSILVLIFGMMDFKQLNVLQSHFEAEG